MKKLILGLVAVGMMGAASASYAGGFRLNVGISLPLGCSTPVYSAPACPPVVSVPTPVYTAPVYCPPAPVVYAPAPVVCAPRPVVCAPPVVVGFHYGHPYHYHGYYHHR